MMAKSARLLPSARAAGRRSLAHYSGMQPAPYGRVPARLEYLDGACIQTFPPWVCWPTVAPVYALSATPDVRLFASAAGPSFSYLKDNTALTQDLQTSQPVSCFYFDHSNHVGWLGTLGCGLLHWKNGVITHIRIKDGLYDNRIYAMLRDDKANLWFASSKGIFRVSEAGVIGFRWRQDPLCEQASRSAPASFVLNAGLACNRPLAVHGRPALVLDDQWTGCGRPQQASTTTLRLRPSRLRPSSSMAGGTATATGNCTHSIRTQSGDSLCGVELYSAR